MAVLTVKTAPAIEPITLQDAKDHLRVTTSDEDALIVALIRAARRNLEWTYERAMLTQTLVMSLDRFDHSPWISESFYGISPSTWSAGLGVSWSMIPLRSPVQAISSVKYIDPSGVQQTLDSSQYSFDSGSDAALGRIYPALNKIWPVVALEPNVIQIEFLAGFTSPDLVPDDWRHAVKLYIGHLYENREQIISDARAVAITLPMGIDALMGRYGTVLLS